MIPPKVKTVSTFLKRIMIKYQQDPSMTYAHSISSDNNTYGFMTAGVAVAFVRHFGKPTSKNCINSHLAHQQTMEGQQSRASSLSQYITANPLKLTMTLPKHNSLRILGQEASNLFSALRLDA